MPHGKSKPQSGPSLILERVPHRADGRNRRRGKRQENCCSKLSVAAALAVAIAVVAAAYFTH